MEVQWNLSVVYFGSSSSASAAEGRSRRSMICCRRRRTTADRATQTEETIQAEKEILQKEKKIKFISTSSRAECYHSRSSCWALARSSDIKELKECKICKEKLR